MESKVVTSGSLQDEITTRTPHEVHARLATLHRVVTSREYDNYTAVLITPISTNDITMNRNTNCVLS